VEDHLTAPTYPQPAPGWPGTVIETAQGYVEQNANLVGISEYVDADGHIIGYNYGNSSSTSSTVPQSQWVYRSGSTVLCEYSGEHVGYSLPSSLQGPLSITVDTNNGGMETTSTATHTEWDLPTASNGADFVPAPLVLLKYSVPLDLTNTVDRPNYQITVNASYQQGYTDSSGGFTLTAWASYDDGQTWVALGSQPADKSGNAQFGLHTPSGATNVTLRVRATDSQGNSIDQTITRAWHVSS
jgi:hypothetical protein